MRPRKTVDIISVLEKKGFRLNPQKEGHKFYYLYIDNKKYPIYTFFSHGKKEYDKTLMDKIKKQLKFIDINKAENFFDCPMTGEEYVIMLRELEIIK